MTSEYAIALFGIFISLCAIAAFIWAIRHRQFRTSDQAMYEAVADDEPDYAAPPVASAQVPRRARWLFALVFVMVFALIGWLIVQTVRIASQAPPSPAARSSHPSE